MALKHYNLTMTGAAVPITSTTATRKGIRYALIHNTGNNSSIYIGDSTVSASSFGHTLASSEEVIIGPFSGDAPLSTAELYIHGTAQDIVHVLVVTH
jgi:hypothetical protein